MSGSARHKWVREHEWEWGSRVGVGVTSGCGSTSGSARDELEWGARAGAIPTMPCPCQVAKQAGTSQMFNALNIQSHPCFSGCLSTLDSPRWRASSRAAPTQTTANAAMSEVRAC
eukprot:352472-Chlamydomonas_euryale.AAC.4